MNKKRVAGSIRQNEGFEGKPYIDPIAKQKIPKDELEIIEKHWNSLNITVGYGRCLQTNPLSEFESDMLLLEDLHFIEQQFKNSEIWEFIPYGTVQADVLMEMAYQMGFDKLLKFEKTLEYVKNKDYEKASIEMLDSAWYRDLHRLDMLDGRDSLNRAEKLSNLMKGGK